MALKVFTFSYPGVYLTGYAVVVAENKEQALGILMPLLTEAKLPLSDIELKCEMSTGKLAGRIVWDGDY